MTTRYVRQGPLILSAVLISAVVITSSAVGANDESAAPAERAHQLWKEGAGLHLETDYLGAVERYRRALRLHPTAQTHTYLAWSLSRLGRYREAVSHCRMAIAMDPDYPNAYNDLGAYLVELDRPAEAIPWLQRAAGFDGYCCPHYAHYQLGRAYILQARLEEARRELETALSIRPDYRVARRLLERIRSRQLRGL